MPIDIKGKFIDSEMTTDAELNAVESDLQSQIDDINLKLPDPEFKFVNNKNDFPAPVNGVITLGDNVTYFITKTVDLTGDRLQAGQNTTIIGGSSENCILLSSGLDANTALITSIYSLPMRHFTITHGTALNLNGSSSPTTALDWLGLNFSDCPVIGTISNFSNFIMTDCAVLNSSNMTFNGTIGTIGFINCLFSGRAGAENTTLNFPSTLTVTRRIRCIYSSFVAFASAKAIYVDPLCSIPVESYILDTVNFSGSNSTFYTTGVTYTDNKAFFSNCKGIINSSAIGQAYYNNNTTQNAIATTNVFEKIVGTTIAGSINQKFSHTNNRLEYTGGLARSFKVTAFLSAQAISTNATTILVRIAKNGVTIAESEAQATTSATGRNESFPCQAIIEMTTNDYVEMFIANATNANNLLVTELNVVIEALN